jgi:hypothetical protein
MIQCATDSISEYTTGGGDSDNNNSNGSNNGVDQHQDNNNITIYSSLCKLLIVYKDYKVFIQFIFERKVKNVVLDILEVYLYLSSNLQY